VTLDIWGDGSNKDELQAKIIGLKLEQEVFLKGWASESDKLEIYRTQSILILPSYFEGMPNVVLEAMANGLPVIASNISTLKELIEHNKNGFLFEIGNVNNLADHILKLGLDPLLQKSFRDQAKLSLIGHESWRAAQHLAELIGPPTEVNHKPSILILSDWFEPAYKGGGPITSCYNFCVHFNDDFDIKVITSNKDFKSKDALPVPSNSWIKKEYGIQVYYASGLPSYLKQLLKMRKSKPDVIYLQGIFSFKFGILPLVCSKVRILRSKFIVAPRGMLQSGAIGQKKGKKVLYLLFARILGLFSKVHFQATDKTEKEDIHIHTKVKPVQISVLPNFPNLYGVGSLDNMVEIPKKAGSVKLVYYSRVSPKKNLEFYLDVLQHTFAGNVELGIIGPIEDEVYWQQLRNKIDKLPLNVTVNYYGAMPLKESLARIKQFHFMVLPTLGENYGHVIVESFSVGVPVIISKNTPWIELESKKLGWDLDLDIDQFRKNLNHVLAMKQMEYDNLHSATINYVEEEIRPEIKDLKIQYEFVLNKIIV